MVHAANAGEFAAGNETSLRRVSLAHSRKNLLVALVSGKYFKPRATCAVVRESPRMLAIDVPVAQSSLVLSSFENRGHVRYNDERNWRTTVNSQSIRPNAAEPSTMPFAQRLTLHD